MHILAVTGVWNGHVYNIMLSTQFYVLRSIRLNFFILTDTVNWCYLPSPPGQSRANMIPLKQPRNIKASNDTLASIDLDSLSDQPALKATPPPLPKKAVPRSSTEPTLGGKEPFQGALRPRAEAKPGGTNLSVANPLYDMDSTWETASQSSSLSSEPLTMRAHDHESGDSLERPSAATAINKGRPTNSTSSQIHQTAPPAPSTTTGRERRAYLSTESLAGRGRGAAAAAGGGCTKPQRGALYRGLDSWDEVVGRIRGLHMDTLRKLAAKCEDRFMAGQKDHLRFGTDSWSHFRLTTGKPCCEAGDAVYYTASYAKDPLVKYAIKVRCLVWITRHFILPNDNVQIDHFHVCLLP